MGGEESQQINRRYKGEPKGNLGTEKYSNQKKKKKSSVVGLKSRMEEKEEIISDLEGKQALPNLNNRGKNRLKKIVEPQVPMGL